MKIKITLFLLMTFICQSTAYAQEFAPIGAKWRFPTFNYINSNVEISVFESIGDTIIENKACRIISKNNHTCFSTSLDHYVHQRNDSIFRYDTELESFQLMFIQNSEVGDVWTIPESPDIYLIDSMLCLVDSISYFHHSPSDSLRVQHVTLRHPGNYYVDQEGDTIHYEKDGFKIYEDIGFDIALFPVLWYTICDAEHEDTMRCYEDDNIGLINFGGLDCSQTSTEDVDANAKIKIYPNPTTGDLIVESDFDRINKIEVFNLRGQRIIAMDNVSSEINLSDLENGVYVVRLFANGQTFLKQIIIQR